MGLDILPQSNEEYGTKEYWDKRYEKESDGTFFDWFKSYDDIAPLIRELIPDKTSRILMLGCGNSRLSEQMYNDGYNNIVNVDYSSVVIQQMRERHAIDRPEMEWHEMDVRALAFETDSFDVAVDKGTMDAMMTSKGDVWDPPEEVIENCTKEVDEVLRVLRKGTGTFIYLTFGQPHFRRRYLTRPDTTLQIKELGEAFHYYLYIVKT
ncbi:S-adenosyl-L-methionine-dependent methyltransferase [Neolentinus lepideus HHB14362 ss-1]|uniref:S-adenosyl-L-methionine-dependent methyltransferase n=1 Tax=Neolentinus lepideus HHB14362 ss-1 TaxID=1314782 RepID=A0A165SJG7_9AGAM|nr:S-adenosyl-L-methionine-dependent methyltransferase [Neolentinus lepideus HHB14362 ss-1]